MADPELVRIVPRERVDQLGEGPLWSPTRNALFWVDILGCKLHRLALADDATTSWDLPEMIGWVIERQRGAGFIVGLKSGFAQLDLDPFSVTSLAVPGDHPPHNRFNDAKADARGRIYAGSMPMAIDQASGCLYRLDPDGSVTTLDTGYTVANGPAIHPSGRFMYHTDSVAGRIYRFDIMDDGSLGPRALFRQFAEGEGKPDGMTFDSEGGLWVAHWGAGRIGRYSPDGRLDVYVDLPASQVSSCCFAGVGLDRMFVTSAAVDVEEEHGGALFEIASGYKGLAPYRFGG